MGAAQFCTIKIVIVIVHCVKQSQSLAIASLHFVPLAMTNDIFTHLGCSPFDRLLIAQSIVEQMPIISIDEVFDNYPIERFW